MYMYVVNGLQIHLMEQFLTSQIESHVETTCTEVLTALSSLTSTWRCQGRHMTTGLLSHDQPGHVMTLTSAQ